MQRRLGKTQETGGALGILEEGPVFRVPDITHLTREVVIAPAAPFTGSATYRRESPHPLSWTGDLSVDLPGFGNVRLAGRHTTTTMCADDGCGS